MPSLKCHKCATALKIPASFTGKAARCPSCRAVVAVPRREEEEVVEAVEAEQEEKVAPAPRRKPRLSSDAIEPEGRKRRRPQRDEEDEPEEDDRPRRRRRGRKERPPLAHAVVLYLGIGIALLASLVVLGTLGFKFKGVSYAMLIIGAALAWVGTQWILHVAKEEGMATYYMCLIVPFYDTWFTFTRIGLTWIPCILVWGGRFFIVGAIALLITHFVRDGRHDGGGRGFGAGVSAAEIDRQAEELLRRPDAAEARAWLADPNRRRSYSDWGRQAEVQFVNDLYTRGAVRVSVADIDPDDDGEELAMHLVVAMPTEPEKRRAVLDLINQRLRDEDGVRSDRGQKYEVLTR